MSISKSNELRNKLSLINIYMSLIMIMPISTLLQDKISAINRVIFFLIFCTQIVIICNKITWKYLFIFQIALTSYIIVVMNTENFKIDNAVIYFINFILYSGVICINKKQIISWIEENSKYIRCVMIIWTIAVTISIFIPSCYYIKEGGGRYFGSYVGTIFRLGPTALFIEILALVSITFYKRNKDILFMIVPIYCGFMGSSRTYFVIIICVFCIALYIMSRNSWSFILKFGPLTIVGILLFSMSSMSEKVRHTLNPNDYGDFWFRITSSRSVIWEKIINGFNNLSFFKKIFGGGFGFSNSVANHYAHNDFIEILATHGYIGIILYTISIILLVKVLLKNKKIPIFIIYMCIFIWIFNAFFNMFYWYICAALSYPFLLLATSYHYDEKEKKNYYDCRREIK